MNIYVDKLREIRRDMCLFLKEAKEGEFNYNDLIAAFLISKKCKKYGNIDVSVHCRLLFFLAVSSGFTVPENPYMSSYDLNLLISALRLLVFI